MYKGKRRELRHFLLRQVHPPRARPRCLQNDKQNDQLVSLKIFIVTATTLFLELCLLTPPRGPVFIVAVLLLFIIVVALPELPPTRGANIISVLIIIVRILIVVSIIVVVVVVIVLIIVILLVARETGNRECK